MSAQTVLEARLRARDDGLVGQLNAAEQRAKGVASGLNNMAGAARGAATATGTLAASDREAARAARDVERARKDQERAARAAARAEQQAADALSRAQSRHRTGQIQLGQQAQDFLIQIQGGTPFFTAFSQQASQATGALALMGGQVDGNSSKLAKFASIMGGPFGIGLGVAIPLVSILSAKLFENSDASDEAEAAAEALSKRVSDMATFFDLATGAVIRNSQALIANARLQRMDEIDKIKASQAERDSQIRSLVTGSIPGDVVFGGTFGNETGRATIRRSGPSDLVRAIAAANGDQAKIGDALLKIIRDNGPNAARARELIDLRGQASFDADRLRTLSLEEESLRTGRLAEELRAGGRSPRARGSGRSGAGSARALANFGESAAEKIQRISDAYNPAPSGIDKAFTDLRALDGLIVDLGQRKPPSFEKLIAEARDARVAVLEGIAGPIDTIQQRLVPLPDGIVKAQSAIRELDGIIAVLSDRKPPDWEQLVARAQQLKAVAAEAVDGPLNDMVKASREQFDQQMLVLQGRDREAAVLARIQQLTRAGQQFDADRREQVEGIVDAEERINDLLDKRQDIISIYMSSIGDLRGALEDLFSGGSAGDFLKNTQKMARQFSGRMAVERLFGDSLRDLEKQVRGTSPLDREIKELAEEVDALEMEAERGSQALKIFTEAVARATGDLNRGTVASASAKIGAGAGSFLSAFSSAREAANSDIVVTGKPLRPMGGRVMEQDFNFFRQMGLAIASPVLDGLDDTFGSKFFGKLAPAVGSAFGGFLTAGPVGGVLGAIKDLPGLPKAMGDKLGAAMEGAQTGTIVAGVGKALGLKMSTTGSQVGGAIGSAIPIPGGDIIGSVLGGFVGGLFKKSKKGSATITGIDEDPVVTGNSTKFRAAAGEAAGSVQDVLSQIADSLGGDVGSFNVSIGVRNGKYRVDPTGQGRTKAKKGVLDFGDDAQAAVMAAAFDAIGDGAITGLSVAVQRALQSNSNIDKAIREALKVQEVEEIVTGLGGALERQFREFEAQAKERVRIATQYGFDVAKIEERNAEDRAKLIDDILSSRIGSLQQLLDDLKFGDLFEGSAADRRGTLLNEIATARGEAERGVEGAADRLADLSRKLVETSREAYGTAGGEYAADRAGAISTAEAIIAAENERVRAAQQATLDTSKAAQTQNILANETNNILAEMLTVMRSSGETVGYAATGARFAVDRQVPLR